MDTILCVVIYVIGALTGAVLLGCYEVEMDKRKGE
jgi:hypothetical protein